MHRVRQPHSVHQHAESEKNVFRNRTEAAGLWSGSRNVSPESSTSSKRGPRRPDYHHENSPGSTIPRTVMTYSGTKVMPRDSRRAGTQQQQQQQLYSRKKLRGDKLTDSELVLLSLSTAALHHRTNNSLHYCSVVRLCYADLILRCYQSMSTRRKIAYDFTVVSEIKYSRLYQ